jgi:tetratricopeptide (TPR) repeat protein
LCMAHRIILISFLILAAAGCGKDERLQKAESYLQKGLQFETEGSFTSAAEQYQAALTVLPEYKEAYFQLGNIYEKLNLPAQAREYYLKAVALDPDYAQAYNNLGNVDGQCGALDRAIADYQKAIALDERLAVAHYNLGHAYILKNDLARAEMELKRAVDLVPGDFKYTRALAVFYRTQQKNAEAIALMQPSDKNPQSHFQLAMAYKNEKRYDDALRELEIYLSLTADLQQQNITRQNIREMKDLKAQERLAAQRKLLPNRPH